MKYYPFFINYIFIYLYAVFFFIVQGYKDISRELYLF
jgi:hypothetical protein